MSAVCGRGEGCFFLYPGVVESRAASLDGVFAKHRDDISAGFGMVRLVYESYVQSILMFT